MLDDGLLGAVNQIVGLGDHLLVVRDLALLERTLENIDVCVVFKVHVDLKLNY